MTCRISNLMVLMFFQSFWLLKKKHNVESYFDRYKSLLVVNEKSQWLSIDCDETFSLLVKQATLYTVLKLAISFHWSAYWLDLRCLQCIPRIFMRWCICINHRSFRTLTIHIWFSSLAFLIRPKTSSLILVKFSKNHYDSSLFIYWDCSLWNNIVSNSSATCSIHISLRWHFHQRSSYFSVQEFKSNLDSWSLPPVPNARGMLAYTIFACMYGYNIGSTICIVCIL